MARFFLPPDQKQYRQKTPGLRRSSQATGRGYNGAEEANPMKRAWTAMLLVAACVVAVAQTNPPQSSSPARHLAGGSGLRPPKGVSLGASSRGFGPQAGRPGPRSGAVQAQPLEGVVKEWAIPVANALPHDPAVDPAGNVWVTLMRANELGRFDPTSGEWKFYPVPTPHAGPHGLVADARGDIWFTENFAGKIGRLNPSSGKITEYRVPGVPDPHTPIFGPDGMLWFTAQEGNVVTRFDAKTGAMRVFRVPTPDARPYGIVTGPDGNIWFCEFGANKLGRIDPETGKLEEYELPLSDARPRRLVVDGHALYFTDFRGGRLGRLDLRTMSFKFWPSPSGPDAAPYGIGVAGYGDIWYNEFRANQLVEFDPRTEKFLRFPLASPRAEVRNMARDASGRLWLAMSGANKLAVIE
jgi:virginiamycin B lyase